MHSLDCEPQSVQQTPATQQQKFSAVQLEKPVKTATEAIQKRPSADAANVEEDPLKMPQFQAPGSFLI